MTVIDESVNADEYADMEFVEFLEFLVRIAYHQYLGDENGSIGRKLSDLLREILALVNFPFVEAPNSAKKLQMQASVEDVQAFNRFMAGNDDSATAASK